MRPENESAVLLLLLLLVLVVHFACTRSPAMGCRVINTNLRGYNGNFSSSTKFSTKQERVQSTLQLLELRQWSEKEREKPAIEPDNNERRVDRVRHSHQSVTFPRRLKSSHIGQKPNCPSW